MERGDVNEVDAAENKVNWLCSCFCQIRQWERHSFSFRVRELKGAMLVEARRVLENGDRGDRR